MFDAYFARKFQALAKQYREKHPDVRVVAVAGSMGKVTTRRVLAQILSQSYRVRMHDQHRQSVTAVPLELLGINLPEKHGLLGYMAALRAARQRIKDPTDVDVVIQEFHVTQPGDLEAIGTYLQPDITVLADVSIEHCESFKSLEAIGQEYMSLSKFSKYMLINVDQVDSKFAEMISSPEFSTYGTAGQAEFRYEQESYNVRQGYSGQFVAPQREPLKAEVHLAGEHMLRAVVGAYAAAVRLGMEDTQIHAGIESIHPLPGRMNPLEGIGGTVIVDDTYEIRPASVAPALQAIYTTDTDNVPQRIVVLGDIQDLGDASKVEHEKLVDLIDPGLVTWLVTVGKETEAYVAPGVKQRGGQVRATRNAIEAAEFVRSVTEDGSIILVVGASGLYLEETVKALVNLSEHGQLVRQDPEELAIKQAYFNTFD